MSPCASLESKDTGSDPEYGIVPDRYTFQCIFEVNNSSYYFMHVLASFEMAPVRVQGDGTCNTVREVELRGFDPCRNLEDLVAFIYSDMRRHGIPLLRVKLLKKTHGKRLHRQTIARLRFFKNGGLPASAGKVSQDALLPGICRQPHVLRMPTSPWIEQI